MEILKVDIATPNQSAIEKAAEVLKRGGLVIYPTDTAYGLGGNALDEEVVKKVYEAKGRNFSKPTHVVVRDWEMIENLTYTTFFARKIFEEFMPGPVTMVLQKKEVVPEILTANSPTLGVRFPKNTITQMLSSLLPFPYTTPSANKSGGKTPYSLLEVESELGLEKIDFALDAGVLPQVLPSTVIDLSTEKVKVLRPGPIKKEEIEKALGLTID